MSAMGSAPSPPPAPDPAAAAAVQGDWNFAAARETQILNNTNQVTPYGTLTYTPSGQTTPIWTPGGMRNVPTTVATTTLSPEMQALSNQQIANAQTSANTAGTLGTNVQNMLSSNVDLGPNATAAYLDKLNTQTLDPQFKQAQTELNQQLANQGLTPGSEGWNYQQTQFGLNKANTYNNMYLQGQNTAVQDILAQYNEPLNALNALQSGSQVGQPGIGTLAPTSQQTVQPAPYANLVTSIYGDQTQQYDAQVQAQSQMMGGLFGLGGSVLGGLLKSDRRDKTDIEKLGKHRGVDMYAYRYKGDPKTYPKSVGPMAQDVEKKFPGSTFGIGGHRVINTRAA
jgi:hypothetical protein